MPASALWKLPAIDLTPDAHGGWQVQAEPGLGTAQAVFAPLRRVGEAAWELALAADASLPLTAAPDRGWTAVPLLPVPGATDYLCMLRYDHPADRPAPSFIRLQLRRASQQPAEHEVTGAELLQALQQLQESLGAALALQLVPAPASADSGRGAAQAATPSSLCFAFASCQYPPGLLDRVVAYRSYGKFALWLQQHPAPERLLLLGDQVYTDATYGLLDPARLDDRYRVPYEELKNRESGPFAMLPQAFLARRRMMPDDHEIADNWEPQAPAATEPRYALALQAYWENQRRCPPSRAVQRQEQGPGWRLFMADSRTQREFRDEATLDTATLLGSAQTQQLADWLRAAPAEDLKVVTTAAMLLPRLRKDMDDPLYLDNWQGYPASFHGLLALLCELQARNLVFLSGDAHLACSAQVQVTNTATLARTRFTSHHAPALYAPYPFANEDAANLLLDDRFDFSVAGQSYHCVVRGALLAGTNNGVGLMHAHREGTHWRVRAQVLAP